LSSKLKESLKESVERNHHHSLEVPDRSKIIEKGMNYLEFMRQMEKRRVSTPNQPV